MKIERSMILYAPRSRVWQALTNKREFESWFRMQIEGEFEPGAQLTATVNEPGYEVLRFPMIIQQKEPERVFAWRWIPGDAYEGKLDETQMTLVTFKLEEVPQGTRVTVQETGFDRVRLEKRAKAFEGNQHGWQIQFSRLETYVRGTT